MPFSATNIAAVCHIALAIVLLVAQWPMAHPCWISGCCRPDGSATELTTANAPVGCNCAHCAAKRVRQANAVESGTAQDGYCPPSERPQNDSGDRDSNPCDHACKCRLSTHAAAIVAVQNDFQLGAVARLAVAQPVACDHMTVIGVFHPPRAA